VEIEPRTYGDVLVVSLSGRINHKTADPLRDALMPLVEQPECGGIVLDLGGVDYMSSVGLRVLMLAAKTGKRLERPIVVAGLQPTMREIFEISRFNMVFDTYESVRDALGALSPSALGAFDRPG